MPKKKRSSALYQRGPYRLDWDRRSDGSLRSPYLAIFWNDPGRVGGSRRGGGRSSSTGTTDVEEGKTALDAFFLEQTTGEAHCPTCGQPKRRAHGYLVTAAIADYLVGHARRLDSYEAVRARLDHVLDYVDTLPSNAVTCDEVDEPWIARFRQWAEKRPIKSPKGKERPRSLSTIEGSVAQLSAAINFSYRRGDAPGPARFKTIPIRALNHTPQHRSAIEELAAMFRYCVDPDVSELVGRQFGRSKEPASADVLVALRRKERSSLHRFLMLSVATLARPDAAYDFSLEPSRRQWVPEHRIAHLNPKGRRQTRKFRASVRVARQVAPLLDAALEEWKAAKAKAEKERRHPPAAPFFVGTKSIRKAWAGMAMVLNLPGDREAGEKLIRRSMGDLLRSRLPEEAWGEITMFMGHDRTDPVTSLYAPFSPSYLRRVTAELEAIIDEIEARVPGAFRREFAGATNVVSLPAGRLNA